MYGNNHSLTNTDDGIKNDFPAESSNIYRPANFIDRMDLAYAASDFVIARSGAMTVAEVTAVGLPACFVPLPIGNGEQSMNAEPVVAAGGAIQVPDVELTANYLRDRILPLVSDPNTLVKMAQASKGLGHKNSASDLADLVLSVARKA